MSFIKGFTDTTGTLHAESYWYPTKILIDYKNLNCSVSFEGFKDITAANTNKDTLSGAKVDYIFSGTTFLQLLGRLAASTQNPLSSLVSLLDTLALETKNIQVGEGETATFVSFFETATQVVPTLT